MKSHEFASLLCSRLCHDLLSPVGALNNGIELLADEHDPEMRARCLDLLGESARASRVSTSSEKPPAAPNASRKNLSLFAEARALSPSRSRQRARISGSCSSARSSMPLLSAPTGDRRSWQSREQSREANSCDFMRG